MVWGIRSGTLSIGGCPEGTTAQFQGRQYRRFKLAGRRCFDVSLSVPS